MLKTLHICADIWKGKQIQPLSVFHLQQRTTAVRYVGLLKKRAIQRPYANDLTHLPAALEKETRRDCGNYITAAQLTTAL